MENRKKRKMEKRKKKISETPKMKPMMETAQTQIAIKTAFKNHTDEEIDTAETEEE